MKKELGNFKIRKGVFYPLCAIYLIVILLGVFMPEAFATFENGVVCFAAGWFGWLYQIITIVLVVICVWVLVSKKVGNIKIGGPDAKPTMSKWNWFAISLCGGIATGIVFWASVQTEHSVLLLTFSAYSALRAASPPVSALHRCSSAPVSASWRTSPPTRSTGPSSWSSSLRPLSSRAIRESIAACVGCRTKMRRSTCSC